MDDAGLDLSFIGELDPALEHDVIGDLVAAIPTQAGEQLAYARHDPTGKKYGYATVSVANEQSFVTISGITDDLREYTQELVPLVSAPINRTYCLLAIPVSRPAWIDTAITNGWGLNTWASISGVSPSHGLSATNNCFAVAPSDWAARGDQSGVMKAWCGSAYASASGVYGKIIAWGGGHGDYCGNEVYAFDCDTRTWSRITEHSPDAAFPFSNLTTGWWPAHGAQTAGSPAVFHTYNMIQYHPGRNSLYVFFGQTNSGANSTVAHAGELPFATNVWVSRATSPYVQALEGWSTYDSLRDKFICHGAAGVSHTVAYLPTSDTYTQNTQGDESWAQVSDIAGAYDSINDFHCVVNQAFNNMYGLDAGNLGNEAINLTTSGKPTLSGGAGFEYCAAMSGFIYHSGVGTDLYLITKGSGSWSTATWTWVMLTSAGNSVTPESNESAGIYSKLQVATYGTTIIAYLTKRTGQTGTGSVYAFRLA